MAERFEPLIQKLNDLYGDENLRFRTRKPQDNVGKLQQEVHSVPDTTKRLPGHTAATQHEIKEAIRKHHQHDG